MSLTGVKMSEDVWLTCLTHALSTETEEIMGLLLGDIEYLKNGRVNALIWGASPQSRSDRRKDRVETNPEQLAAASAQAERMTAKTGRTTRVIGWYHSHPHITVFPSHVDVRTQAMYQLLDPGFIGLIFSCFSEDTNKVGRIQVIAFQSSDGKQGNMSGPIPVSVVNTSYIDVDSSPSSSENAPVKSVTARRESPDQDTGDSRSAGGSLKGTRRPLELGDFFANADASYAGGASTRSNCPTTVNLENAVIEIDPMDMSDGMQEAMHRSNLDMSGAEYVRKEITLQVLPTLLLLNLDSPLVSLTDLQRVLFEEERGAYNQAITQNLRNGRVHPLAFIHHTSTYQASLCKLMEYCLSPAISALQDRLRENEIRLSLLAEEAMFLEKETTTAQVGEAGSQSPVRAASSPRGTVSPRQRELHSPSGSFSSRGSTGFSSRHRTGP
ncbi:Lys-63-specific deubiquitinase BRCC36 [Linum grandiflorum]